MLPDKVVLPPPSTPSKEEVLVSQKKPNFWLWGLIGGVVVMFIAVMILIIFGVNLILNSSKNTSKKPAEPPITEKSVPTVPFKSKFATDSGVLKLRDDLVKLQSDVNTVDILEPQLAPPNLDLNISIQSAN